ncbi:hypothetical protein ACUUYQ_21020 [Bacillus halotolerans]|nr:MULTISPECIES: hypothetical protein [Bacillus subtilis group]MEC0568505.1 hypothetical protein [Bacillus spizizenii]MCT6511950.1 hypothetical protein [Bacillus subtilis]MEC0433193.1 hypothetical protein [Bacillus subtilis]MEC0842143.1 hypothetical protein [Bacillus spizizenii]MEC1649346.1 hypothetical protein [Bacillus halotolerans]
MKKMSVVLILAFGILALGVTNGVLNHSKAEGEFETAEIIVGA